MTVVPHPSMGCDVCSWNAHVDSLDTKLKSKDPRVFIDILLTDQSIATPILGCACALADCGATHDAISKKFVLV